MTDEPSKKKAQALAAASRVYRSLEIIRQERDHLRQVIELYSEKHSERRDVRSFQAEIDGLGLRQWLERELDAK